MAIIHRTPPDRCPACGTPLNGAAAVSQPLPPADGDYTLCIECLAILRFEADALGALRVRRLTPEQIDAIPPEYRAEIRLAEQMIAAAHAWDRAKV